MKASATCPLCLHIPGRRRITPVTLEELTQSLESVDSDVPNPATRSLLQALVTCGRFIEKHYSDWLVS